MIRAPWTIATFAWVPDNGPLSVELINYLDEQIPIGSIYLPKADLVVALSATPTPPKGNPFYETQPPVSGNNPQTIPMPSGTMQVTLSAVSSSTYYVVAASGIYRPLMEGSAAS